MPFRLHHLHVKSATPKETADWYVQAFGLRVLSVGVSSAGAEVVKCATADGAHLYVSGPKPGEELGPAVGEPSLGLEHFGLDCPNLAAEVARLETMGAEVVEGPTTAASGTTYAFLRIPPGVLIEVVEA